MTPLTALYLAEHCFDGLPAGEITVVTGYGLETGEPLVKHPDVPVIAFTGSLATGQRIASLAAPMMKKLHLELGGKDATVIAEDADPEIAAKAVAYAALINAGQVCTSTERVYLPQNHAAKFTEAIVEHVKTLRLGSGMESTTDMGPMIGETYRAKFESHIADAKAHGAKILTGGGRPSNFKKGFFHQPTVLSAVDHSMVIILKHHRNVVVTVNKGSRLKALTAILAQFEAEEEAAAASRQERSELVLRELTGGISERAALKLTARCESAQG